MAYVYKEIKRDQEEYFRELRQEEELDVIPALCKLSEESTRLMKENKKSYDAVVLSTSLIALSNGCLIDFLLERIDEIDRSNTDLMFQKDLETLDIFMKQSYTLHSDNEYKQWMNTLLDEVEKRYVRTL